MATKSPKKPAFMSNLPKSKGTNFMSSGKGKGSLPMPKGKKPGKKKGC